VAVGLGTRGAGRAGLALAVLLCTVSVALTVRVRREPELQKPDWRGLAAALGPSHTSRLVVAPGFRHPWPLLNYLSAGRRVKLGTRVSADDLDVIVLRDSAPTAGALCWWGTLCLTPHPRDAPVRIPARFRLAARHDVGFFEIDRYLSHGPHPVRTARLGDNLSVFKQRPG
jgi:hypothetical protein